MFLGQCHQSQTPSNALIINSVPCDRFMWQNKYIANIANIYQLEKETIVHTEKLHTNLSPPLCSQGLRFSFSVISSSELCHSLNIGQVLSSHEYKGSRYSTRQSCIWMHMMANPQLQATHRKYLTHRGLFSLNEKKCVSLQSKNQHDADHNK